MNELSFVILLLVASKTVLVASEQRCSRNDDCDANGCCFKGSCTTNGAICTILKRVQELKHCYSDWNCPDGCCVDSKCKPKSSDQCKSCFGDWQCDSDCCKYGKCQESYECDSYSYTTTKAPRRNCVWDYECDSGCCKNDICQESYECDSYYTKTTTAPRKVCDYEWDCDSRCCKNGMCQESYECPTTSSNTCYSFDCGYNECCINGYCQYCYATTPPDTSAPDYDDYDDHYGSSSSSSSGLSAGAYIGIAIAGVVLVILKLALWASWCSRRERVVVVRRRITCVTVPIVNEDELQQEHERRMQPDRPPPAYSPRPFQDNVQPPSGPPPEYSPNPPTNENEHTSLTEIAQNQRSEASGGVDSVPQDHAPPPAYSPSLAANTDQNPVSGPTQSAGVVGTTDETDSVRPRNTITLPAASSSSPVGNLPQNNTEQNSTPMNPTQRENATPVTDESNADPWNNTIGPFVI